MFVGIDVSKERLDVAVRPTGGTWQEPYDPDGIISLAGYVRELMPHLVVADATGDKELVLAGELATARLSVEVVNPRHVREFARASGKLAKTVAQDAQVLAHFAEAMIPERWTPARCQHSVTGGAGSPAAPIGGHDYRREKSSENCHPAYTPQ